MLYSGRPRARIPAEPLGVGGRPCPAAAARGTRTAGEGPGVGFGALLRGREGQPLGSARRPVPNAQAAVCTVWAGPGTCLPSLHSRLLLWDISVVTNTRGVVVTRAERQAQGP